MYSSKLKDAGEQPLLMTYKDAWTSNCPWNSIASDLAAGELYMMNVKPARPHSLEPTRKLQKNI